MRSRARLGRAPRACLHDHRSHGAGAPRAARGGGWHGDGARPRERRQVKSKIVSVAQEAFEHLKVAGLEEIDPDIAALLGKELERQRGQIELIASENFTWPSILE